jgi:D-glycero-D-manno-heptose 1,7-bisphosphate phosphatase
VFLTNFAKYQLVIFDRDGVLNQVPVPPDRYILHSSALFLIQRSIKLIADLQKSGKNVAVATNQQGIGKGVITWNQISEIHNIINVAIVNEGGQSITFYVCPHIKEVNCNCRKPKPGLIEQGLIEFRVDKTAAIFIGDQLSDKHAAESAGVDFAYFKNL